jgi:hypothetical protein
LAPFETPELLSGFPGFVLCVPPGSTPSIASLPVVRDDDLSTVMA